jgi:hypothetical protein
MSPTSEVVMTAIVCMLAVLSIALKPAHAIVAYILLAQFDFGIAASYADTSLGSETALKAIVIPTILLWRIRPIELMPSGCVGLRNCWLAFVGYAALAAVWSPYRLSAAKMIGYFYAYTALFVIFTVAWRRKWLRSESILLIGALTLLFGIIQTYFLGNPYGDPDYDNRFTGFTGAQSFSPFLVSVAILLVLCVRRTVSGMFLAGLAVVGVLLSGSRYNVLGLFWVILVAGIAYTQRRHQNFSFGGLAKNLVIAVGVAALVGSAVLYSLPKNRVNEMLDVFTTRNASVEDVRTVAWRFTIYAEALDELSSRGWRELLVGSGTSSAATVAIRTGYFEAATVDYNRCMHDEFLRCVYEWGAIGLLSFVAFLWLGARLSWKLARFGRSPQAWACLAVAGPLLLGLVVENILALGASAAGVGYCLIFSSLVAQLRPAPSPAEVRAWKPLGVSPLGATR